MILRIARGKVGHRQTPLYTAPLKNQRGFTVLNPAAPTLPHSRPCSTIGAKELNFRVRDGNGCDLLAIATEIYLNKCMTMHIALLKIEPV